MFEACYGGICLNRCSNLFFLDPAEGPGDAKEGSDSYNPVVQRRWSSLNGIFVCGRGNRYTFVFKRVLWSFSFLGKGRAIFNVFQLGG